jgi:L-lactate dehydrogenase complex protein LldG
MTDARAELLGRIRSATRGASAVASSTEFRSRGALDRAPRVARFCERVGDYRAEVRRVTDVAEAVAAAAHERAATRFVVPPGLPHAWRPSELELVNDVGFSPTELDRMDGVITGCTVAIAETGTIVLSGGAHEGRRAITLVPDIHICVVDEARVVELVLEAFMTLAELGMQTRPITFISGPSATSDIELSRVEGVHGPRELVVLVRAETSDVTAAVDPAWRLPRPS